MEQGYYIDGRYKILSTVGSGGMANVYLAEDLILEREVAIKVLRLDFREDEESIRRFRREAESTTNLNHANIVSVSDVGIGENPYIVMEYVEGMNLKEFITLNDPISYPQIINIMTQILSGVGYAHRNDVIHRDLKPQNILINKQNQAKISDFGIAIALSQNSITQTNSLLGSVQYISPERARGRMASIQSDIYSLGIILYEMITGKVPFEGESAVSVALRHFQEEIPSLKDYDENIPQALENVVLRATAKEPKDRYNDAFEMREDLKTVLDEDRKNEERILFESSNDDLEETIPMEPVRGELAAVAYDSDDKESERAAEEKQATASPIEENPQGNEKRKRRKWPWLLLLLILFFIGGYFVYGTFFMNQTIELPDLTGLTQDEAIEELEELNLELGELIEEASEEYEEGHVTRSNPRMNTMVREESEVDLYLSTGREAMPFPDLVGTSFEEARAHLTELGFTVEREDESSPTVEAGYIIAQDINPNTEVIPEETTVEVTVSTGEQEIILRDLTNYSWRSVQDYAADLGLYVVREEQSSDTVPESQVISQNPAPQATLYPGDSFTVVISTGPEEIEEPEYLDVPVTLNIEYIPNTSNPETEDSEEDSDNSEDTSDTSDASEEETTEAENNEENQENELNSNEILIYVDDAVNDYDSPYRRMLITNDTTVQIQLQLEEGETGRYRVLRDGTLIEESEITA